MEKAEKIISVFLLLTILGGSLFVVSLVKGAGGGGLPGPNPPVLSVIDASSNTIMIEWTDSTNAGSYDVERKAPGETSFTFLINIVDNSSLTYTHQDQNLLSESTYYYRVKAKGPGGEAYSNEVSQTTCAAGGCSLGAGPGSGGPPPNNNTGSTTGLFIDTNTGSYVGIGTNSPTERLTIADGSIFQGAPIPINVVGSGASDFNPAAKASNAIFAAGRFLYVAIEDTTPNTVLRIVDISNPQKGEIIGGDGIVEDSNRQIPRNTGTPDLSDVFQSGGVFKSGKYLYMIFQATGANQGGSYFRILDVSNLKAITVMGGQLMNPADLPTCGTCFPTSLFVAGRYAYLTFTAGGTDALRIIDISDPMNPFVVKGSETLFSLPAQPRSIIVNGRYAYIASKQDGSASALSIVDIQNPLKPVVTATLSGLPGTQNKISMAVSGKYAYIGFEVVSNADNFRIIDISNPNTLDVKWPNAGSPSLPDVPPYFVKSLAQAGRYVYLAMATLPCPQPCASDPETPNKIRILDVIDPANPKVVGGTVVTGKELTPVGPANIALGGKYLYVAFPDTLADQNFLRVIDISGVESVTASVNTLQVDRLQVIDGLKIGGDLSVGGSLTVGSMALFNATTSLFGSTTILNTLEVGGTKQFVIDDPRDPENRILRHAAIETPALENIYDGVSVCNVRGEAIIKLPEYFEALNKDILYQFKSIGAPAPLLRLKQPVKNNIFIIAGCPKGKKVSWQVTGKRNDAYARENPLVVEEEKKAGEGYIHPEIYLPSHE